MSKIIAKIEAGNNLQTFSRDLGYQNNPPGVIFAYNHLGILGNKTVKSIYTQFSAFKYKVCSNILSAEVHTLWTRSLIHTVEQGEKNLVNVTQSYNRLIFIIPDPWNLLGLTSLDEGTINLNLVMGRKITELFSQNGNDSSGGTVEEHRHHVEKHKVALGNYTEGSEHLEGSLTWGLWTWLLEPDFFSLNFSFFIIDFLNSKIDVTEKQGLWYKIRCLITHLLMLK